MLHTEHTEREREIERLPQDQNPAPEGKPVLFAATSIALIIALWFFLFGHVRPATEPPLETPPQAARPKIESAAVRRPSAPSTKNRPGRNGEEKALLLYLLRVFDRGK